MKKLDFGEILELGLCPYDALNDALYRDLRAGNILNMIKTFEEVERIVETYNLPAGEVYATTGKDDLVLFDGKTTFQPLYPIPAYLERVLAEWEKTKKRTEMLEKEGAFDSIFNLMDVVYRGKVLQFQLAHVPPSEQRDLVLSVREMMEYQFGDFDETTTIPVLLETKEGAKDLEALRVMNLPEVVTLYRGEGAKSTPLEKALSWSLSPEQAHFFANRFGSDGKVFQAEIARDAILAYIDSSEEEVLVQYKDLANITEYVHA